MYNFLAANKWRWNIDI